MVVNPKNFDRKSANTYNYYTLLMDNNPKFSKFPKRKNSIICSSDFGKAERYGKVYTVLPRNGSVVAICPKSDIWFSFSNTFKTHLGNFNDILIDLFDSDFDSFDELKTACKKIDNEDSKKKDKYIGDLVKNSSFEYDGDLLKLLLKIITPEGTSFSVTHISSYNTKGDYELWTDGECILIHEDKVKETMKKVFKEE